MISGSAATGVVASSAVFAVASATTSAFVFSAATSSTAAVGWFSALGSSLTGCSTAAVAGSTAFSSTGALSSGVTAEFPCNGCSFSSAGSGFAEGLPAWLKSILPSGLTCCLLAASIVSALWLSGSRFFSLSFFFGNIFAAWFFVSLSLLNSSTSASYCASLILKFMFSSTSPRFIFFCRYSTAVWSPMLSSLITLFNLIAILLMMIFVI